MFTRLLVCSDGSEHALSAARVAAEIARKFNSYVTIVNVQNPVPVLTPYASALDAATEYSAILECLQEAQKSALEHTAAIFKEAGIACELRAETGHEVDRIVSVAEEEKSDLIVMGSRGLGGFQRFLLGSISNGVLHHAHCPVLIVR